MTRFPLLSLDWLLAALPAAVWLHHSHPEAHIWVFVSAALAILPLAKWLGVATEHLSAHAGEGAGGLLNATFGNAAELIIAIAALRAGLPDVVKASLAGSIIGNILLVAGLSILAGGFRHPIQHFHATAARTHATLLTLAAIALIVPAMFHYLAGGGDAARESDLSLEISLVLLAIYAAHLVFSLVTHKKLFGGEQPVEHRGAWKPAKAVAVLAGSTALIAWASEILVASVEPAARALGMTSLFVGVVVVAVIGNAAEHSTAVVAAWRNRMDLSLGIAIGSSIQIALLVAPVLVLISYSIGPRPMDLVFSPAEVVAVVLAVLIVGQIASDGESNWMEGAMLLATYAILTLCFYFLPESASHAGPTVAAPPGAGH